jgi:hypothetical protein
VGIISSIFARAGGGEPPDGYIGSEEGFVDIDLPISKVKRNADDSVTIVARGKVHGSVIGLIVDILPKWAGQETEDGTATFYWGKARCRSLGQESDQFVGLLAKCYGMTPAQRTMLPSIEVSAVGLNDNPKQVLASPIKMKFFFEENSEENYSEVFINIDVPNQMLEFHEKDPDYRIPLLRSLGGNT